MSNERYGSFAIFPISPIICITVAFTTCRAQVEENSNPFPLQISAVKSEDVDNSEYLSVELTVLADSFGPIGTITAPSRPNGVGFQEPTKGKYLVTAGGSNPDERESRLNALLSDGMFFKPRPHYAGVLEKGIQINAISTEQSSEVAPADSEEWGT